MKKIYSLILLGMLTLNAHAEVNPDEIKGCEKGEASPALCIDLHKRIFKQGEMPVLRDKVPMMCFVSEQSNPSSGRYFDSVTQKLGTVFKATLNIKNFTAQMADQKKSKTVAYLTYDEYGSGPLSADSDLATTSISWRPRVDTNYQGEVQFTRRVDDYDWARDPNTHAFVYDWVTEYKGQLLVYQNYFENYYYNLKRNLRCIEIRP